MKTALFHALRCTALAFTATGVLATPSGADLALTRLTAEARASDPAFGGFSAARGQQFFSTRHGGDWRCSTCHGDDPTKPGRHTVTGKAIAPLAPAGSPERFTQAEKTEKWFRRNCNDVLGRTCTTTEKGDLIVWLKTFD